MPRKIPISFDFDDTLSKKSIQDFASFLQRSCQFDIWIVTSRFEDTKYYKWISIPDSSKDNKDIFEVALKLNIPRKNIHFTNRNWKYKFFQDKSFLCHLDDFSEELNLINRMTLTKGISCQSPSYIKKIMKLWKEA